MKEKNSKISVVMPVYNEEKFLDESMQSILNQTFTDFEFIIINDASTDNSLKIIKKYNDKRINLINNKENKGFVYSENLGLKKAKGKYIAIFDADDISHPKRFEIQFNYLENNPHIFLVGSSAVYMDEYGKEIQRFKKYDDYKMLAWRIPQSCSIVHTSTMFRNEGILYNKLFKGVSDYDFYLNLLRKGKNLTNLPQFLVKYRFHHDSVSILNYKEHKKLSKMIQQTNTFRGKFKLKFLFKLFIHYLRTFREKNIIKYEEVKK